MCAVSETVMTAVSPGRSGFLNLTLFSPVYMGVASFASEMSSTAACAIISHWMTPGTMGLPGKCPCRKNSSPLTVYLPTDSPASLSSASSNRSMGSRWGRMFLISSLFILPPYDTVLSAFSRSSGKRAPFMTGRTMGAASAVVVRLVIAERR